MSILLTSNNGPQSCQWDWCREIFDTADKLAKHVIDEHVMKAEPVRREDVPLELRANDGTSMEDDSFETPILYNGLVSFEDGDKEMGSPEPSYTNGHTPQTNTHQQTADDSDDTQDDFVNGDVPQPPQPQHIDPISTNTEAYALISPKRDPSVQGPLSPQGSAQTPSPSSSPNGFQALADNSSASPDPEAMKVAPAPSIAEMLANTINGMKASYSSGIAGPSSLKHGGSRVQTKPPSSKRTRAELRPASSKGTKQNGDSHDDNSPRKMNGAGSRPSSSHSQQGMLSRTTPNSSSTPRSRPSSSATPSRPSSKSGGVGPRHSQNQTIHNPASKASRPFRSGSIRLEPYTPPLTTSPKPSNSHSRQSQTQSHSGSQPPLNHETSDPNNIDMLSSSYEQSIPPFSQAFDIQSQMPLATQAPYSYDSQLSFSSQS